MEIDLIPLMIILSRGVSSLVLVNSLVLVSLSVWELLLLLLLITLLLNSNHPGGGCLIETSVKLFSHFALLVWLFCLLVGAFSGSTSINLHPSLIYHTNI